MATVTQGWQSFRVFLEMIKIEHSVFALPFAMIGMMWGSEAIHGHGWPGWPVFLWILLAMVSCRSAAMAYNRIADREIDAANPRTKMRAIPAGLLSLRTANLYFYGSIALFVLAAAMLNPLALMLSPLALLVTLGYSLTKRFTPLCHFVLGFGLGIAPAAAWIAVTGSLDPRILLLTLTVTLWTAGFDLIYSLQDEEFDKSQGLRSMPQTIGKANTLFLSRVCHLLCLVSLGMALSTFGLGVLAWVGFGLVAALLVYEQSLVKPNDLSKVNLAFFTLNGFVSIGFFVFILLDKLIPLPIPVMGV